MCRFWEIVSDLMSKSTDTHLSTKWWYSRIVRMVMGGVSVKSSEVFFRVGPCVGTWHRKGKGGGSSVCKYAFSQKIVTQIPPFWSYPKKVGKSPQNPRPDFSIFICSIPPIRIHPNETHPWELISCQSDWGNTPCGCTDMIGVIAPGCT